MSAYDWAKDEGIDWLRQDPCGVTILKVDAAEAWMPPVSVEAAAEKAAAERHSPATEGERFPDEAGFAGMPTCPNTEPHECDEVSPAAADAVVDALMNDLLLLEAVQKWSPMDTLDIIGPNIEDAARLLALVRATVAALRRMDDDLTAFIADVTPPGSPYSVEGVGALTIRPGAARKGWDHDGIRSVCAAAIADDLGVLPGPVGDVIQAWLEFTGPPSRYRTTSLKPVLAAADHTLDEFVTTTWGAKTVEIQ